MAYGQTMIQEDLYLARRGRRRCSSYFEASTSQPHDVTTGSPYVTYVLDGSADTGSTATSSWDATASTGRPDGHPDGVLRTYEKAYPFGWLGILSETPPLTPHLLQQRRAASRLRRSATRCSAATTCSARSTTRSATGPTTGSGRSSRHVSRHSWPTQIVTGPSIEKSIAPLRSFVAEPMRYGNLFLAGDAAHIVPPTGAKGLNLAISDVYYLSRGFAAALHDNDDHYLDRYSEMALRRVWARCGSRGG